MEPGDGQEVDSSLSLGEEGYILSRKARDVLSIRRNQVLSILQNQTEWGIIDYRAAS
jgi:hypothetical protein